MYVNRVNNAKYFKNDNGQFRTVFLTYPVDIQKINK